MDYENFLAVVPVLPSADVKRDAQWYAQMVGFETVFMDDMYAGLYRDGISLHLQGHHGTEEDPVNGGSVVRIFVQDVHAIYEELVSRGTVNRDKLRHNTDWNTHEFGFFDLNKNAIFMVQDAQN